MIHIRCVERCIDAQHFLEQRIGKAPRLLRWYGSRASARAGNKSLRRPVKCGQGYPADTRWSAPAGPGLEARERESDRSAPPPRKMSELVPGLLIMRRETHCFIRCRIFLTTGPKNFRDR